MIDVSDEISISSTNEDDTIHHLVIDQRMDINEIVVDRPVSRYFHLQSMAPHVKIRIFCSLLTQKTLNKPQKEILTVVL